MANFVYAKLPDGSYAKFKAGTTPEQMRAKLTEKGLLTAKPSAPPAEATAAPEDPRSLLDQALAAQKDWTGGAIEGARSLTRGIRQLVAKGAEALPEGLQQAVYGPGGAEQQQAELMAQEAAAREAPALQSLPGKAGKLAFDIGSFFAPGAAASKTGQGLPLLARIASQAGLQGALGAAQGATAPITEGESRGTNTALGAALGAGGGVLAEALPTLYKAGKTAFDAFLAPAEGQAGRLLAENAGAAPLSQLVSELRGAASKVSPTGYRPTVAEAVKTPSNLPMLQDAVQQFEQGQPISARNFENIAGRKNTLTDLAGRGGARESAEALRESIASQTYPQMYAEIDALAQAAKPAPPSNILLSQDIAAAKAAGPAAPQAAPKAPQALNKEFEELAKRPAVQAAIATAARNAENAGKTSGNPLLSGEGLHQIKRALEGQLKTAPQLGIDESTQQAIRTARNDFDKAISDLSPKYRATQDQYRALSRPVNQMEVADELFQKLGGPSADFGNLNRENAQKYLHALRSEESRDQLVKKITGQKGLTFDALFEPEQKARFFDIAEQIAAKQRAGDLRGIDNSLTAARQNAKQALTQGERLGSSGLGAWTAGILPGVGALRDRATREALTRALLDPSMAADLLEQGAKSLNRREALAESLRRTGYIVPQTAASQVGGN